MIIKMRNQIYEEGLKNMISYIDNDYKTNMIEIGSYIGESTLIFKDYFKKVISIDPYVDSYDKNDIASIHSQFEHVYQIFLDNIKNVSNVEHIKLTSDSAYSLVSDFKVDLVYIDGLHTYDQVKKDIINYIKLVNNNGYIAGHDYHSNWSGVIDAVNEVLGEPDKIFKDTSWIKRL